MLSTSVPTVTGSPDPLSWRIASASAASPSVAVLLMVQSTSPQSTRLPTLATDLSGTDLSGDALRSTLFSGTDFKGTDFSGIDASTTLFSGTDLSGDAARSTDFSGTDFNGDALRSTLFSGTDFKGTDFNGMPASERLMRLTPSPEEGTVGSMPKSLRHDRPFATMIVHQRARFGSPGPDTATSEGSGTDFSGVAPSAIAASATDFRGVAERSSAPNSTSLRSDGPPVLRLVFSAGFSTSSRETACKGLPASGVPISSDSQPPGTSIGIDASETDFNGTELSSTDFNGTDFSGTDFSGLGARVLARFVSPIVPMPTDASEPAALSVVGESIVRAEMNFVGTIDTPGEKVVPPDVSVTSTRTPATAFTSLRVGEVNTIEPLAEMSTDDGPAIGESAGAGSDVAAAEPLPTTVVMMPFGAMRRMRLRPASVMYTEPSAPTDRSEITGSETVRASTPSRYAVAVTGPTRPATVLKVPPENLSTREQLVEFAHGASSTK